MIIGPKISNCVYKMTTISELLRISFLKKFDNYFLEKMQLPRPKIP